MFRPAAHGNSDRREEINCILDVVMPELKRRARALMRGERPGHLLQPTALVSEAFLRLFRGQSIPWNDPPALIIAASGAMGQALIDHARWNRRQKRMGHLAVQLPEEIAGPASDDLTLLTVRKAVDRLRRVSPRQADIVQMRFFAGLEINEIAAVLEVSDRTVKRELAAATARMRLELGGSPEESPVEAPGDAQD